MESPTDIIPENLMYPRYLKDVMAFLIALPVCGDVKAKLFFGWARLVGVKISASQRNKVLWSGTDYV